MNEYEATLVKRDIHTRGIITKYCDSRHHIYQSTFWPVLGKLIQSGYITRDNHVVDYGSGLGRVAFCINNEIGCKVTGVEFAEEIFKMAEENLDRYGRDKGVKFVNSPAENYDPAGADTFYFFNPFPVDVVKTVVDKIVACPTAKRIIFYCPMNDQEKYLKTVPELVLVDEIDCRFTPNDASRNKLLIFDVN